MITKTPRLMAALTKIYDEISTQKSKTVCFTSSAAKEGKTIIACAVAEVAASLNQKVLYCDFTDYPESLSKHLKKKFRATPMDYLELAYENIHFIEPLGFFLMPPPAPIIPTLLRKGFLAALLDQFKKDYDLVILDCSFYDCYIEGVLSANNLSQASDATVLVARSCGVTESHVKRTADKIIHDGGKLIGIILNDVDYPRLPDDMVRASHYLDDRFPETAEKIREWIQKSDFLNTEN